MGKQVQRSQTVRLNKLIADCGIASRREADRLIDEGHVRVNGKKVFELGTQVNPHSDNVFVNGKPIKQVTMKLYMAFFKPAGVLTTMSDPHDRPNISHYLKNVPVRVFPVGRLDFDSEGLILLTNDGDFAQRITHPKNEVTKTYIVKLRKDPAPTQIQRLLRGVTIKDGKVAAKSLVKINRGKDEHPWFKIVITEGKNRQIRQMFEKINNDVLKLQRVAIGRLTIGSLKRGQLVYINEDILEKVFLPDIPEEVIEKQGYKGEKQQSTKFLNNKNTKKSTSKKNIKSKVNIFKGIANNTEAETQESKTRRPTSRKLKKLED